MHEKVPPEIHKYIVSETTANIIVHRGRKEAQGDLQSARRRGKPYKESCVMIAGTLWYK
jgi:hypothetical protein